MTFASPELLLTLLLVPIALVAYLLLQRRRARYVVRFTNVALLENLVPHRPSWRRHVPTAFYLAAIAALGIALARPTMVVPVPREEATVVMTMDTSRSMLATDVSPDRLTAAKAAASDFIASLPEGFRVALVGVLHGGAPRHAAHNGPGPGPGCAQRPAGRWRHGAGRRDRPVARGRRPGHGTTGHPAGAAPSPAPDGAVPAPEPSPDPKGLPGAAARRDRAPERRQELHGRARAPRCRRRRRDPGRPVCTPALGAERGTS